MADEAWNEQEFEGAVEASTLTYVRSLIDQGRRADPDDEGEPLEEVFDLVLHQGSLQPGLLSVLDDLCRILPDRPDVAHVFFNTLVEDLDANLGHPRWFHALIDDYRYPHSSDQAVHRHLVRLATHFRFLLESPNPTTRVAAANLVAHAGREYPDSARDVWAAALATQDISSRAWMIGTLKCYPPQPMLLEPLERFISAPQADAPSAFTALTVLLHWGVYTPQDSRTAGALHRLSELQEEALRLDEPISPHLIRADAQVARGRTISDPDERWAGWTPFLSERLFTDMLLGRIAYDVMGDPQASELLAEELTRLVRTQPRLRGGPAWEGVTAMLQTHGIPFPNDSVRLDQLS